MIFKFKHEKKGGHVHIHVFSAPRKDLTFALLGRLIMSEHEWHTFELLLGNGIPDGRVEIENVNRSG